MFLGAQQAGNFACFGTANWIQKLLDFYSSVSRVYFILRRSFTCCHNPGRSKADIWTIRVLQKRINSFVCQWALLHVFSYKIKKKIVKENRNNIKRNILQTEKEILPSDRHIFHMRWETWSPTPKRVSGICEHSCAFPFKDKPKLIKCP